VVVREALREASSNAWLDWMSLRFRDSGAV
jgi:hypothetical protein